MATTLALSLRFFAKTYNVANKCKVIQHKSCLICLLPELNTRGTMTKSNGLNIKCCDNEHFVLTTSLKQNAKLSPQIIQRIKTLLSYNPRLSLGSRLHSQISLILENYKFISSEGVINFHCQEDTCFTFCMIKFINTLSV